MKVDWFIVTIFLAMIAVFLGYGLTARSQVVELEANNAALQWQVDSLQEKNATLIDQKDKALADLYKAGKLADKALERQFYRGVAASGFIIVKGLGATELEAAAEAIKWAKAALMNKAYEKTWPGDVAPGTAPQLAPDPPGLLNPDRDKKNA